MRATTTTDDVNVAVAADVEQVDETGSVWALLDEAGDADRVRVGSVVVTGAPEEPFLALRCAPRRCGSTGRPRTSCGSPSTPADGRLDAPAP
jgi:hypothetical protein